MLESTAVVFCYVSNIMEFWEGLVFFPIVYLAQGAISRVTAIGREKSVSESDLRCANLLHLISTTVQMSSY